MKYELESQPITPDMADDWREHIMPALPSTLAIGFEALVAKVYERLEEQHLNLRGSVANAVLAMAAEGELVLTASGNIQNACAVTRAA